jgi:hypothetical protein
MKPSKKAVSSRKKVATEAVEQETVPEPVVEVPVLEITPPATPTAPQLESVVPVPLAFKQPLRLLLVALFLGWTFDFLFWEQSAGVNFALFLTLGLIGGLIVLLSEGYKPARVNLGLIIPFVFFAIVTFTRQESLTIFLAYTFTLLSLGLLSTSYIGGRWHTYRLSNYIYKFLLLVGDLLYRPLAFFGQARKVSAERENRKVFPLAGVFRGFVIALPIVLCFGSLLASADVVFNQKLDDFFDSEKIFEYLQRSFLMLVFAYLLAGVFLHAATKSRDENLVTDKALIKPFLGFAESTVILGSVALLFLLFVVVQFQYFFGGQTNIGVEGFTYSQYARRGFNELVIVAFFSLVLILGLSTLTNRENETQKKIYSGLSVAVVGLVMVILVSAYQRISLAIAWHGFSRLRLYPRVFLIWLGILLLVVAVLELYRREQHFAFAAVLASIGFAVSLTLVNVDAAIVKHNVPRVLHGKNLNVAHMASLSTDAVPALVEQFYSKKYSQSAHEGIGAALTCYLQRDTYEDDYSFTDWRSFNLSRWQAHLALQKVEKDLQEYGVNGKSQWDWKVRTPSRVWYPCRYYESTRED